MVTEKILRKQASRLMRLPFALQDPDEAKSQQDEFERVLRTRALTDGHCAAIVDYVIDHSPRCPPPAEVLEAAEAVEIPETAKAPMGCEVCRGSGFRSFSRQVRIGQYDYVADFATFCSCTLGEFKRTAEAKRKVEAIARSAR